MTPVNQITARLEACSVKTDVKARTDAILGVVDIREPISTFVALTLSGFFVEGTFLLVAGEARILVLTFGADTTTFDALLVLEKPALSAFVTLSGQLVTKCAFRIIARAATSLPIRAVLAQSVAHITLSALVIAITLTAKDSVFILVTV